MTKIEAHSFSPQVAALIGLQEAIILKEIVSTCEYFERQGYNYHYDSTWYFDSAAKLHKKFSYISRPTIGRKLQRLEALGLILSSNLMNKRKADRTKWYTPNLEAYQALLLSEFDIDKAKEWVDNHPYTIAQNEQCNSQNEQTIAQNEQTIAQNEQALPPSTTPSTTPSILFQRSKGDFGKNKMDKKEEINKIKKEKLPPGSAQPPKKKNHPGSLEALEKFIGDYQMEVNGSVDLVLAQEFWDYYESNGWKVGKNPMRNWKAAARQWVRRQKDKQQTPAREDRRRFSGDYKADAKKAAENGFKVFQF